MAVQGCSITSKALALGGTVKDPARSPDNYSLTPTRNRCRLLTIAAELRNRIYELSVVEDSPIAVGPNISSGHLEQPALTRTCRQIRQECLPIFYDSNTFRLYRDYHPDRTHRLDFDLALAHMAKMKHIQFQLCTHGNYYELDLSNGLQEFVLKMVIEQKRYDPFHEHVICFVNSATLAKSLETLQDLVEQGVERISVLDLEHLAKKLMRQTHKL